MRFLAIIPLVIAALTLGLSSEVQAQAGASMNLTIVVADDAALDNGNVGGASGEVLENQGEADAHGLNSTSLSVSMHEEGSLPPGSSQNNYETELNPAYSQLIRNVLKKGDVEVNSKAYSVLAEKLEVDEDGVYRVVMEFN